MGCIFLSLCRCGILWLHAYFVILFCWVLDTFNSHKSWVFLRSNAIIGNSWSVQVLLLWFFWQIGSSSESRANYSLLVKKTFLSNLPSILWTMSVCSQVGGNRHYFWPFMCSRYSCLYSFQILSWASGSFLTAWADQDFTEHFHTSTPTHCQFPFCVALCPFPLNLSILTALMSLDLYICLFNFWS